MDDLGDDVLQTGAEISQYVLGNNDHLHRRKIYHLVATGRLPVFRLGNTLCARKSTLRGWIEEQERLATKGLSNQEEA